ncbi:ABC-2 family transporter protein [Stieleria maiorica]|uniref:ABC-2 family transporter protein n=1 Tax=Stieleria maiorica TaxID=2795974 RepID=A0A5B9MCL5_9BACT|nr:ABC transporter permease [Stieleria maiorica]QEF99071.1 ABC-2 family transporter protein [Stieleria maiorica]
MHISLRRLLHNRVELLLTFVVPIAFFSVFALIFGKGIGSGTTPKVKVVVVDEMQSPVSATIVESLRDSAGLRLMHDEADDQPLTFEQASKMVRHGSVTIAIVLKADQGDAIRAELLADASDQVAGQVVSALVGRELVIAKTRQASRIRQTGGVRQATVRRPPVDASPVQSSAEVASSLSDPAELVQIVDVIGEDKANPVVSMYAAGIAVMFLLFGATGGGGVLLEERENTTLDRLLSTELTMDQLLLGKWFYLTALGFVQVCVMFLWGQFAFGVDLRGHLDGFVMMTLVTSSAAAAFGLFLATLCKTRGQLNGLSVILILTMSALGGSMVPRYVMSERMRELGLWTFNAWALDGYDKVFWRDLPVEALSPQLAVLMIAAVAFLLVARALAIRWEFD